MVGAGGLGRRASPAGRARGQRKTWNGFSLSSEATAEDRFGRMSGSRSLSASGW